MARFNRKKLVVATVAIFTLCAAGGAVAYWTAGGSGTGSGATGTSTAIVAVQTSTVTNMRPGDTAQAVSGNFDNANDEPVYVTSVTTSIASVFVGGVVAVGCDATDYTLATPIAVVGHEVASGTGVDGWSGATLKFNNKVTNQDACKNAVVNLAFAIL